MANIVATTLKTILEQKGLGILSDPRLLKAILLDICPLENTDVNLLLIALQENIPQELLSNTNSAHLDMFLLQLASKLESNYCIEKSKACLTVESWAYALGLPVDEKSDPNQQISQPVESNQAFNVKFTRPRETLKLSENCSIEFIRVKPGEFIFGSPLTQRGRMLEEFEAIKDEVPIPFYLSVYPITVLQFMTIEGYLPALMERLPGITENSPVCGVKPAQAEKFCNALSRSFGFPEAYSQKVDKINFNIDSNFSFTNGIGFYIPCEREWEYACRAGTKTMFPWADEYNPELMQQYCFYRQNKMEKFVVGQKKANQWGFHDMLGLIMEFMGDKDFITECVDLEKNKPTLYSRVVKGGGFQSHWAQCKPSSRGIVTDIMASGLCRWSEDCEPLLCGFRIAKYADD